MTKYLCIALSSCLLRRLESRVELLLFSPAHSLADLTLLSFSISELELDKNPEKKVITR